MESRTDYRRRRTSTKALTTRIAALSAAAALALGGLLSWQMARGADPALGPKAQVQAANPSKRVVRTVVVRRIPAPAPSSTAGSALSPSTGSVVTAPAPSPAPVTTSAS